MQQQSNLAVAQIQSLETVKPQIDTQKPFWKRILRITSFESSLLVSMKNPIVLRMEPVQKCWNQQKNKNKDITILVEGQMEMGKVCANLSKQLKLNSSKEALNFTCGPMNMLMTKRVQEYAQFYIQGNAVLLVRYSVLEVFG